MSAKLFLSAGEKDSESMTGDLTLLEDQLAAKPAAGLAIVAQWFPKKSYFNVLPVAFGEGLAALFGRRG